MRLSPYSFALAALLTALVAIAPLSTDMYLPAMPALAAYFGASTAQVQLTLSVYLIGFACAQLILGPLSDRFGRRPVLIAAFLPSTISGVIAPIFFYAFSVGFIMPNSMAGAIGPFPHMAGTASALLGFTQMALSAFMGLMVGVLFDGTQMPMMAVICTSGTLAWLFSRRIEHSAATNPSDPSISKD